MPPRGIDPRTPTSLSGSKSVYRPYRPIRSRIDSKPRRCDRKTRKMPSKVIRIRILRRSSTRCEAPSNWHNITTLRLMYSKYAQLKTILPFGNQAKPTCFTLQDRGRLFRLQCMWPWGAEATRSPDRFRWQINEECKRAIVHTKVHWRTIDRKLLKNAMASVGMSDCQYSINRSGFIICQASIDGRWSISEVSANVVSGENSTSHSLSRNLWSSRATIYLWHTRLQLQLAPHDQEYLEAIGELHQKPPNART